MILMYYWALSDKLCSFDSQCCEDLGSQTEVECRQLPGPQWTDHHYIILREWVRHFPLHHPTPFISTLSLPLLYLYVSMSVCSSVCSYYLASAAEDSVVKLWDLRKLKNFKTLELDQGYQVCMCACCMMCPVGLVRYHCACPLQVQSVCFDQTGTYLAVGGTDIQ